MQYNVEIDDIQQEKFISPIFRSIINHVDDKTLIKIFMETNIPAYMEYIPDHIKNSPDFIKEGISKGMIYIDDISPQYKNSNFISKEEYLSMLSKNRANIQSGLYPQDKEVLLAGASNIYNISTQIEAHFLKNTVLMAEMLCVNVSLFHSFPEFLKADILKDNELTKKILTSQKTFFEKFSEDKQHEKYYLKIMLSDKKGYDILDRQNILRKITDEELVLDILKIDPSLKVLHQKFSSIVKKHGAQNDPFNFLKTYFVMNSLNNNLENRKKT